MGRMLTMRLFFCMKAKYLLLLLFVLRTTMSLAQGDIVKDSIKIDGVYLTFDEFRNNSPSLRGRILVLEKEIKLYDSAERRFRKLEERYWGACSNNYVYVAYRQYTNSKPLPFLLESIGTYCFFTGSVTTRNSYSNANFGMTNYGEFVVNINNGTTYKLSDTIVETIFFKKYILEYNSKHKDEIKPVSR
jgi:hypothetical protein